VVGIAVGSGAKVVGIAVGMCGDVGGDVGSCAGTVRGRVVGGGTAVPLLLRSIRVGLQLLCTTVSSSSSSDRMSKGLFALVTC
jgi:hypothetical protein